MTAPSGPLNVLKAAWFAKHRQQRPAVAVVFFDRRVGAPPAATAPHSSLRARTAFPSCSGEQHHLVYSSHSVVRPCACTMITTCNVWCLTSVQRASAALSPRSAGGGASS